VIFDLAGGTLYLANAQNSSMIVLAGGDSTVTSNAAFQNG
jgi:hypothetical protein